MFQTELKQCVCMGDFREAARQRMPPPVFAYIDSGSESEVTMKDNQTSFHKLMMIPRILISTSNPDMTTEVFGRKFSLPFGFAPWAMNTLSHPDGENIPAQVAYQKNIIYGLSTLSTKSFSQIESANKTGMRFMQMYISKDWSVTNATIRLAEKYGFTGLAITVDAQVLGIRKREKQMFLDTSSIKIPILQEAHRQSATKNDNKEQKSNLANRDLSLNWQTIKKIRQSTKLKIVLKGIMNPIDAKIAVDYCDAIWVSNHGGRQLDGISSTINILPSIKAVVGNKKPIFVDGGVRTGNDVYKCLALGADYVFIARPVAYSLVFGYQGVIKLVGILEQELKRAMILIGCHSLKDIKPETIVPEPSL